VHFVYVRVSPLNHVLLLLDAVSFVCNKTFMFDVVFQILSSIYAFQKKGSFTVGFHTGAELFDC